MQRSIRRISGAVGFCAALVTPALAQESGPSPDRLDEVTVVGTRLSSGGPPEDAALPVTVLDASAIASSGSQSVQELFLKLPQVSGARGARDGNGTGRATLNLRGLGDQYTLTLVNGRRFAANAPANVNAIPFNAIERIKILEAGAGAVYGSDAVAGVVNVVLKDSADGLTLDALYGDVTEGSASVSQAGFSFGGRGESSSFFLSGSFYKRDPLLTVERELTRSNDMRALGGRDNRSGANNPAHPRQAHAGGREGAGRRRERVQ